MFEIMVDSAMRQTTGNREQFVKHWFWEKMRVEGDGLSSKYRSNAVRVMLRTATKE